MLSAKARFGKRGRIPAAKTNETMKMRRRALTNVRTFASRMAPFVVSLRRRSFSKKPLDGRVKLGHDGERLQRKTPRHDLVERITAIVRERRFVQSGFLRGFKACLAIGARNRFGNARLESGVVGEH